VIENLTPKRDGTPLQQQAYKARNEQFIAECRKRAVTLQNWLDDHVDEHMNTEPFGMPEWVRKLTEFDFIERGRLREVFHYSGCIHEIGQCSEDSQVNCTACERRHE
jgi:hypothetical protein